MSKKSCTWQDVRMVFWIFCICFASKPDALQFSFLCSLGAACLPGFELLPVQPSRISCEFHLEQYFEHCCQQPSVLQN